MNISYLEEFLTFSRYMNVSEAARQLHVAQPTLSNHIAALEKEFGCDLVARGKTMRLTPAGRGVLFEVKDDELVLLDEQSVIGAFIKMIPGHAFVPIDEPNAACKSYLAYYPNRVSPGLQKLLDYLDDLPNQ